MKTISEILPLAAEFLAQKGILRSRRDAEELLAAELGCKRIDLFLSYDQPIEEKELGRFREKIKRRASGEPLDYILGEKEFYGCHFLLSPAVLIPRPETEILLEKICERVGRAYSTPGVAFDICTGSGCLGIAFKKKFLTWTVFLSDISEAALEIAKANAKKNDADVTLLYGDLLVPFQGKKAQVMISNPPYISEKEYAQLDPEVRSFEPQGALKGGEDGLDFYRRLAREAGDFLVSGGMICLEIGSLQKESILEIFCQSNWYEQVVEQDWAGHDRFFFARRK